MSSLGAAPARSHRSAVRRVRVMTRVTALVPASTRGPVPRSRTSLGTRRCVRGQARRAGDSGAQALAALGAARIDDGSTAFRGHAGAKPVTTGTLQSAGLKGTFHCDSSGFRLATRVADTRAEGYRQRTADSRFSRVWPQIRRAVWLTLVKLSTAGYAESASRPDTPGTHVRGCVLRPGNRHGRKPLHPARTHRARSGGC